MNGRWKVVRSVLSLPAGVAVIPVTVMLGEFAAGIFLHSHFYELGQAIDTVGRASLFAIGLFSVLLSGFVVGLVAGRYEALHCVAFVAVLIGVCARWANVSLPRNYPNITILVAVCLVGGCLAWLVRQRRLR